MSDVKSWFDDAKAGDREAFDRLFGYFRERLAGVAWNKMHIDLRGKIDTQDVLQETSLRALQGLDRLEWKGEAALFAWFSATVQNVIHSHTRRYLRVSFLPDENPADSFGTSPSRRFRRLERFDRLKSCLESLTPEQRQAVQLVRFEGLTIRAAAKRMNRSENATTQLLWRATEKLRYLFGDTTSLFLPPDRNLMPPGPEEGDLGQVDLGD